MLPIERGKDLGEFWQLGLLRVGIASACLALHSFQPVLAVPGKEQEIPVELEQKFWQVLAQANNTSVADLVEKVGKAVVRIDSDVASDRTGSGFIIDDSGQILTNAHVVKSDDTVTVTLTDGRTLKGKVVGADTVTDVAVVKVSATNLPTIALGDSDKIRPGDPAIAIGNPLGLDNTVTTGIISAIGRSSLQVGINDKRVSFIQTDAAINPGNSGGPLLDTQGQAIGMNTAIIQGAQGLSFAIPINLVRSVSSQLLTTGKVQHAYLGAALATLTPQLNQFINNSPDSVFKVKEEQGVLVVKVEPNSPSDRDGLKAGDVIMKINNSIVLDARVVQRFIDTTGVGNTLQIELSRNGQMLNLQLQLGAAPEN